MSSHMSSQSRHDAVGSSGGQRHGRVQWARGPGLLCRCHPDFVATRIRAHVSSRTRSLVVWLGLTGARGWLVQVDCSRSALGS